MNDPNMRAARSDAATRDGQFPPTSWTKVAKARDAKNSPEAMRALDGLCGVYWYPLYAFARRQGHSPHDAQDLTQGFFEYLVQKDLFAAADPALGKLRTFLLKVFTRFIIREWDRANAEKRGGQQVFVSLDEEFEAGERRYRHEPVDRVTPERINARSWTNSVLDAARARFAAKEAAAGRAEMYQTLEPFLERNRKYKDLAAQLGLTEEALRQTVSRFRHRYREIIRDQIADTLMDPTEKAIDEEMRYLRAALE